MNARSSAGDAGFVPSGRKPASAPGIRGQPPPCERRRRIGESFPQRFLGSNIGHGVVRPRREFSKGAHDVAYRLLERRRREQRQGLAIVRDRAPECGRGRLALRRRDCCPIAAGDRESQRAPVRERRQPQRQSSELHGNGVRIDAGQTSLGDKTPDGRATVLIDITWRKPTLVDESAFVRSGQIPARGHEKRAAAHRRVDDAQRQDPIRGRPATNGASVRRTTNSASGCGV